MNETLEDELTSVNAIYPGSLTATSNPSLYIISAPALKVSLRLRFPKDYPHTAPEVIGPESVGGDLRKGAAGEVVAAARRILAESFIPDEPCIYELIEQLGEAFGEDGLSLTPNGVPDSNPGGDVNENSVIPKTQESALEGVDPPWTLSEVVTDRKSVFVARAAQVNDTATAKVYVQHLLATDKKAAKATHNITAWRIRQSAEGKPEVAFQDCDDDGEDAAGGRLLHLLQTMDVWNVMVVVSRWYGGIQLGPDRFRIINSVARDAIVRGGLGRTKT